MDIALRLAREAGERGEVPVGAVVVLDGKVVGRGSNRVIETSDPTAHAEIEALRSAGAAAGNYRIPGATLYATLEPCAMCAGAMVHARLDRLVYGCADPKTGAAGSVFAITGDPRLNHQLHVTGGVRSRDASRLLRDFFGERRDATGSGHAVPNPDISL
jgi:tRNA(adenine34) deaminase